MIRKKTKRLKTRTKAAAAAAASLMILSSFCAPAPPAQAAAKYTPVGGTRTVFTKYLILRAGTHVPHASFSFSIAPGSGRDAGEGSMQVLAGIGTPSVSGAVFTPSDTPYPQVRQGDIDVGRAASSRRQGLSADSGVEFEPAKGEQYVLQKVTADFSGISFDEPGIYRYILSEDSSSGDAAAGLMHDDDTDRLLDVYVTDDGSGTLQVSSYVLHTDDENAAAGKTDGLTNEYRSGDLIFKHEVAGNQASRDKYFDFTLTLENLTPGDVFTVSIADDGDPNTSDGNADAVTGENSATIRDNSGRKNTTVLTAGEDGKVTEHFFLQHGQSIAVRGLPQNASYSLTENPEDYSAEPAAVSGFTDKVTGTVGTGKKTSYRNTRDGIIPTGVTAALFPGLALLAVSSASLAFCLRRRSGRNSRHDPVS